MAAPKADNSCRVKPGYPSNPGYASQLGYSTHISNPIRLHLSAATRVYKPGDTISGILQLPEHKLHLPTLVLQGIAKSKINACRSRTLVAWQPIELQKSEETPASGPAFKTYSFSTGIPVDCTGVPASVPTPRGKGKGYWAYPSTWKKDIRFMDKDSASVPLPPTCKFHSERTRPKIITDCHIEYAIIALDITKEGASALATAHFWLTPLPEQLPEVSSMFVLHADKRLPFYGPQLMPESDATPKATGLRRIWSGSRSSPKPEAAFLVKVTRPKFMRAGSPIHFWVELEPQDTEAARHARLTGQKSPEVLPVEMPTVKLTEAKVWIQQCTDMRAQGLDEKSEEYLLILIEPPKPDTESANVEGQAIAEITQWSSEDLLASLPTDGVRPAWLKDSPKARSTGSHVDLHRRVQLQASLPDRLVPTFKSYNLARRYKWMLKLSFECAGQVQHAFYQFPGVVIPPPQVKDDGHADDNLDWGPYRLESEQLVLKNWAAELGWLGVDAAKLAWDIGSVFMF